MRDFGLTRIMRIFFTLAIATLAHVLSTPMSARAQDVTLVSKCDEAAASPLDKNRPSNIAGVAVAKVDPKVAVPACEAAAKLAPNDPRIAFQLGRAYGAAKAYEAAREQWAKADDQGYALATNNLAALYDKGLGVTADRARALSLFEKAVNGGVVIAMLNLARLYHVGDGVTKDDGQARRWFEKAAATGDTTAMVNLGMLYENGWGVKRDDMEARLWLEKAATTGDSRAMIYLGWFYQNGRILTNDNTQAQRWYEKAVAAGNMEGTVYLAALAISRELGPDYAEARRWLEKGAAAGNAEAMQILGVLHFNGWGVAKNNAEARRLWEKAAAAGRPTAMRYLVLMYNETRDCAEARRWYEKAAAADKEQKIARSGHSPWSERDKHSSSGGAVGLRCGAPGIGGLIEGPAVDRSEFVSSLHLQLRPSR